MSKKQNSKKKVSIKLKPYESFVVGSSEWFMSIAEFCQTAATMEAFKSQRKELLEAVSLIRESAITNCFDPSYENEYNEWQ